MTDRGSSEPSVPARVADDYALEHRWGGPLLWLSLGAGTVLWLTHVSGMAALTPYSCHVGSDVWLHVLSVVTLVGTLASVVVPWQRWRAEDHPASGVRFLAAIGALINGVLSLAIVAEWVPVFLIDACAK